MRSELLDELQRQVDIEIQFMRSVVLWINRSIKLDLNPEGVRVANDFLELIQESNHRLHVRIPVRGCEHRA